MTNYYQTPDEFSEMLQEDVCPRAAQRFFWKSFFETLREYGRTVVEEYNKEEWKKSNKIKK